MLSSITTVIRTFKTKTRPVLVMCNDLNEYVCRHSGSTPANILFLDYLGTSFYQLLDIKTPELCFVNVNENHIPESILSVGIQKRNFRIPCLASKYLPDSIEISASFEGMAKSAQRKKKICNTEDFLKIALVDIWLSNEDRNHNNYNLLLNSEEDGHYLYAFDHDCIFNSRCVNNKLVEIAEHETILRSPLKKIFVSKTSNADFRKNIKEITDNFYICLKECKSQLSDILDKVPLEWQIRLNEFEDIFTNQVFSDMWIKKSIETFHRFLI